MKVGYDTIYHESTNRSISQFYITIISQKDKQNYNWEL